MGPSPSVSEALADSDAQVLFIARSGAHVVPPPTGFDVDQATVLDIQRPLDLVAPASHGPAVAAFIDARNTGHGSAEFETAEGDAFQFEVFDLRADWDCMLLVLRSIGGSTITPAATSPALPVRVLHGRLNGTGESLKVDDQIEAMLGWTAEEYMSTPTIERVHPDDHDRAFASFAELLARPGGQTRIRERIKCKNGSWLWVEVTHTNLLHTEQPHVSSEMIDISSEMAVQTALEQREGLLMTLTESLPVGVLHVHSSGEPEIVNSAWFQLSESETLEDSLNFIDRLRHPNEVHRALEAARERRTSAEVAIEFTDSDAACQNATLSVRPLSGTDAPHAVLLTLADTTEVVSRHEELERVARRDHLTGALNRLGLEEAIDALLGAPTPDSGKFTIFYFDLNNFKRVNDDHGHVMGDAILVATAEAIASEAGADGLVARLGGDEFALLLPHPCSADLARTSQRISDALKARIAAILPGSSPSLSTGWSTHIEGDTFDSVLVRADAAMYRSKVGATHTGVVAQHCL